ncbi:Deoxyribonuclease II activity protein [Halocaridina rubra]|uniref:Deoxyribonuclease II activity protein n=1 Tax=Halocaridina rubra TaxID=373956 RepID=A0AAN8XS97_HALRR
MATCWTIWGTIVVILSFFCLWNCIHRHILTDTSDWCGCRDQNGNPVDSFVVYKLPREKQSDFLPMQTGTAYMYLTPEIATRLQSGGVSSVFSGYKDSASGWVLSNVSISSEQSMLAHTLRRIYKDKDFVKNSVLIMYNDEFPNGSVTMTKGHTKGVVIMTDSGGFWLIHSVPKYPPSPEDSYAYPKTGHHYGQSMLCISLPAEEADNLGGQLLQNNPYIYASNMPENLASRFSTLAKVINGDTPETVPWYRITQLKSRQGKTFTSFAKYKNYELDLYSGLVAPILETSIVVESWRNGPNPLPSSCNDTYKVENSESLSVRAASVSFSSHKDHSKWAVAVEPDKPYVCIGDINRMLSQFHRGGGTICVWSLSIWHRFHSLVQEVEPCAFQF